MKLWILILALLVPGNSWAELARCPNGVTWVGADVRDCPCCVICRDGSWFVEGEGECPPPPEPLPPDPMARYRWLTKGGYAACMSLSKYLEWGKAGNDKAGREHLFKTGCLVPRAGLGASIIDRLGDDVKVRLYTEDGDTFELWTWQRALRKN